MPVRRMAALNSWLDVIAESRWMCLIVTPAVTVTHPVQLCGSRMLDTPPTLHAQEMNKPQALPTLQTCPPKSQPHFAPPPIPPCALNRSGAALSTCPATLRGSR